MKLKQKNLVHGIALSILILSILQGVSGVPVESNNISISSGNSTARPPVILVVMESVRADHTGRCYGYNRSTAPEMCEISRDGVLFEEAYSQGSRTIIAMPSLLTGGNPAKIAPYKATRTLPDNAVTVDRRLRAKGYETKGYGSFDRLYGKKDPFMQEELETPAEDMIVGKGVFTAWFPALTHIPYVPDERYRRWEDISKATFRRIDDMGAMEYYRKTFRSEKISRSERTALYDETILQADSRLGKVVSRLKKRDLYNESLIIVTSDHGERLKSNEAGPTQPEGLPHGWEPERRVTHVPLIVKFPGNRYAGRRISRPVRHIDIAPTVYDVLGISAPRIADGESLLELIQDSEKDPNPVYSARLPDEDWVLHTDMSGNMESKNTDIKERSPNPVYRAHLPEKYWAYHRENGSIYIDSMRKTCEEKDPMKGFYHVLEGIFTLDKRTKSKGEKMKDKLCSIYRDGIEDRDRFDSRKKVDEDIRDRLEELGYLR